MLRLKFLCIIALLTGTYCYAQQHETAAGNDKPYGNNIISIIPLSADNSGYCYGLSYERILTDDGKLSLYIPIVYGQQGPAFHFSDYYKEKNLGTFLGFKYYPAGSRAPIRYAIGFMVGGVKSFRYLTQSQYPGGTVDRDEHITSSLVGAMVHNSLNVSFAKHFTYVVELDLGIGSQPPEKSENGDGTLPLVLFQMTFGYRF